MAIGDQGFELTATQASGGTNRANLDPSSPWSGTAVVIGPGDPYYGGSTPQTPYGQNCLVLSSIATVSQTLAGLAAGSYTFGISATQVTAISGGGNAQVRLLVDGVQIGSWTPTANRTWQTFTADPVTLAAGNHTLAIAGGGGSNDNALVDNVQSSFQASGPATLVAGTVTPGTPTASTVTLALTGTSGGTDPDSIQFQQAPDANGSPGTWANLGAAGTGTTATATGLNPATKYYFRAIVTDSGSPAQTATTAAVSATTAAAASGSGVTAGEVAQIVANALGMVLTSDRLAAIDKLKGTLAVDLASIGGSTAAMSQLLADCTNPIDASLLGSIGGAAATAVWGSSNRTITAFGFTVGLSPATQTSLVQSVAAALPTLDLDGGAVVANPVPTPISFSASGPGLTAPGGGYVGQTARFQAGALAGTSRVIATHVVAGSVHSFTLAPSPAPPLPSAPASTDTFLIV